MSGWKFQSWTKVQIFSSLELENLVQYLNNKMNQVGCEWGRQNGEFPFLYLKFIFHAILFHLTFTDEELFFTLKAFAYLLLTLEVYEMNQIDAELSGLIDGWLIKSEGCSII